MAFVTNVKLADKATENYEALVCLCAANAMKEQNAARFSGPVSVSCHFRMDIPKSRKKRLKEGDWHTQKPDIDNMKKSCLDGIRTVMLIDDCIVSQIFAIKTWTHGEPGADVIVKEIEPEGQQPRDSLSLFEDRECLEIGEFTRNVRSERPREAEEIGNGESGQVDRKATSDTEGRISQGLHSPFGSGKENWKT
jgi:Holliday junction resolvase RusA-like endonuclease